MGEVRVWLNLEFMRQLWSELQGQFWRGLVCLMLSFICAGRLRDVAALMFEQFLYGTSLYHEMGPYRVVHSIWMVYPLLVLSTTLSLMAYTVVSVNAARPFYERSDSPRETLMELLPYTADLMGCAALLSFAISLLSWGLSLLFAFEAYPLFGIVTVLSMLALLWIYSHVMLVPTVLVMESLTLREAISRSAALVERQRGAMMLVLFLSCGPVLALLYFMVIWLFLLELDGLADVLAWVIGFISLYIPAVFSGLAYERCLSRDEV